MIKSYLTDNSPTRKYDLNLLKAVLSVQSKSNNKWTKIKEENNDRDMIEYLLNFIPLIAKFTNSEISIERDIYGNIYVTKGNHSSYPCIVSHIDTVHPRVESRRVYQQNDTLFAFSDDLAKQVGVGGDDMVGVFTCLQALIDFDIIKSVFYRDEEIGHLGSKHSIQFKPEFYNDCNFILQCDRQGGTDFLANSAGILMCSDAFLASTKPFVEKYGFKVGYHGVSTDVDTLVLNGVGISCVNISSGYYNPHRDTEIVSVKDVGRSYSLIHDIIQYIGGEKFPHQHVVKTYTPVKTENKTIFQTNPGIGGLRTTIAMNRDIPESPKILVGMVKICNPILIPTSMVCTKCKKSLFVDTNYNTLTCFNCDCDPELIHYDWHENFTAVFYAGTSKESRYKYSWWYGAWVEESNAILITTQKNATFWVSKQLYEKEWTKVKS